MQSVTLVYAGLCSGGSNLASIVLFHSPIECLRPVDLVQILPLQYPCVTH